MCHGIYSDPEITSLQNAQTTSINVLNTTYDSVTLIAFEQYTAAPLDPALLCDHPLAHKV